MIHCGLALVLEDDDCAAYGAQEIVQWKKVIETIETERDKILAPQKAAVGGGSGGTKKGWILSDPPLGE